MRGEPRGTDIGWLQVDTVPAPAMCGCEGLNGFDHHSGLVAWPRRYT